MGWIARPDPKAGAQSIALHHRIHLNKSMGAPPAALNQCLKWRTTIEHQVISVVSNYYLRLDTCLLKCFMAEPDKF